MRRINPDITEPIMTRLEMFESKVYYSLDGCHYWLASINKKGYGNFRINKSRSMGKAHRASYVLYKGEIPKGMQVLHRCDNPSCVNPNHLFLGTNSDNVADKVAKNRQHRPIGNLNPNSKAYRANND
jgi:hypothetical protein